MPRGSAGVVLQRLDGVSAAVFPSGPERDVYDNALLERDLGPTQRAAAVDAMEAAYRSGGSSATPRGSTRATRGWAAS
jgi:hypothetical protein